MPMRRACTSTRRVYKIARGAKQACKRARMLVGEDAHWDRGSMHEALMGVGRAHTVVRGRVGVVEGTQRGKASRCKMNFLFTYPLSKYNTL